MSEAKKLVICPQGHEMAVRARRIAGSSTWQAICYCHCGWQGPVGAGESQETAIDAAYLSATRHTENRPLTRDQVEGMPDMAALWEVKIYGTIIIRSVKDMLGYKQWATRSLFFASMPSPEDIEAARAGKENA